MPVTPIKTAIVAFGKSAKVFHAPFLKVMPEYEVVATVERNRREGETWFPGIETYTSVEAMLKNPEIELVVVTTPNDTHFEYGLQSLLAGKHVVIEKPFTITSENSMKLVELSKQQNRIASVYHNRRYVSDFSTIVEILQKNLLGKVHEYECHFDRYRPELVPGAWREKNEPGSGITYDLGSHLIDQTFCLFGLPTAITAYITTQRPNLETDDYFDIRLDYADGKRAILRSGMLVREHGHRYVIHGQKGSFLKSGDDPQEALLKGGALPDAKDWGKEDDGQEGLLHTELNGKIIKEKMPSHQGNYGDYYKNLAETIRNGKPLRERPEHGYNVVRIIELAFESSRQRRTIDVTGLIDVEYPFGLPR